MNNILLIKSVGALLLKAQFYKDHSRINPENNIYKHECQETLEAASEINKMLPSDLRFIIPIFDSLKCTAQWPPNV
jgi:hypothetical protein